ncbi:MAG: DUF2846 domain-containing protein [Caulobacter sp.]|nr:DUF2846 domain-containing protein [Caulobacter sp.]
MRNTCRAAALGILMLGASALAFQASAQDVAPQTETAPADASPAVPVQAEAAPAEVAPVAVAPAVRFSPGELGKPAPGKGQVVFFRQSKLMGAALSFKVRENGAELGKLSNGVYFVLDMDPGLHEFEVHSEAKDVTPIEVEEGEVSYLVFGLSIGVLAGRPNLSPSTKEVFDPLEIKMKPSTWSPAAAK